MKETECRTIRVIVLSEEAAEAVRGALDNANQAMPCPLYAEALDHMKRAVPSPIRIPWEDRGDE